MRSILTLMAILIWLQLGAQTKPVAKQPLSIVKLTTPNDSLQYTLGAYLGQWITNNGFTVTNSDLFTKGLNDVLLNKTLLVPATQVAPRLDSYQKRLISRAGGGGADESA